MSKKRNNTARMLIKLVKTERPDWSAKQCAQWLQGRMPKLKDVIRRRTRSWIKEDLLTDTLCNDVIDEEWLS